MSTDRASPTPPASAGRRRIRWSQVLLYIVAVALIVYGGAALVVQRLVNRPGSEITGEIMPGLRAAERLEVDGGALQGWNVLIVTFDTTRADHLGCYGNRGIETPTLDQLAREGVLFANAATPVPATLPGHSSLLTGLYPFNHGARANGMFKLEEENVTLAEILRDRGYRTGAAISAYVLDSTYGLSQGFELYHDDLTHGVKHAPQMFRERPAELTNEPVFEWLRANGDERFFFWVHYFDPHAVYLAPEPFRSQYERDPYSGEIAYADSQLGELLNLLTELGVRDKTLVVMTSDHGEGLGEHHEQTHSLMIYDATVHVPLIMHAPGVLPEGQVIRRQVSLVDVLPTILDLLAIDAPREPDGISLLQPAPAGPRACYIETLTSKLLHGWAPLMGVRRDDYKFILAPRPEVYDLRDDPHELENLYESHPDVAVDLHELLKGFVGDDPRLAADVQQNLEMDAEALEKLEALGYVMAVGQQGAESESQLDPKDGILHWEKVQQGTHKRNAGDIKGAIEALEACVDEVPGDVWAREMLAGAYQTYGRAEDALRVLKEAEALAPTDPSVRSAIVAAYMQQGELDKAEEAIQAVLALQPDNSGAYSQLAQLAMQRRQHEEALRLLNQALELDRGSRKSTILNSIADFHLRRGAVEEARERFEQALEVDSFNGEALGGLAEILIAEGEEEEALKHLLKAIRFNPVQPRALSVLGGLYSNQGNNEAAIGCCERVLEMKPVYAPAYLNLGLAHRRNGDLEKAEEVYRTGIEQCPPYDTLHQNLAQLLYRNDKADEAFEEFKIAARLNPRNTVAVANVGVFHMRNSNFQLAEACFRRTLQIDRNHAFAHKNLGLLLVKKGRVRRGVAHLRKSLELEPSQPDAGKIRFQLESLEALAASQPVNEDLDDAEPNEPTAETGDTGDQP